jgi:hypothetical protein
MARFVLASSHRISQQDAPMKKLLSMFALALPLTAAAASVDSYAWHNRLLIVFAKDASSSELAKQRTLLSDAKEGMTERDLIPVQVIGNEVQGASDSADTLRRRYKVAPDAFRVVLIGKDGGVKIDSHEPLEPQRVFGTVDTMPMRRQESQQQKPKS